MKSLTKQATPVVLHPLFLKTVLAIVVLSVAVLFLMNWQAMLMKLIVIQQEIHQQLRLHVIAVSESQDYSGLLLVASSFAYGMFHAVGPGHGKAILSAYLSTQSDVQIKRGIALSLYGSLMQAVFAILLVSIIVLVLQVSFANLSQQERWLELGSYVLVCLLGCIMIWRSLKEFKVSRKNKVTIKPIFASTRFSLVDETSSPVKHPSIMHNSGHQHGSNCGCQHHIEAKEGGWKEQLPLVLAMAARPCTGALLVLTYAHIVNIYAYGVLAVLVMGLGTGMSIAGIAYAVVKFRDQVLGWFSSTQKGEGAAIPNVGAWLKITGGALLFVTGCLLISTLQLTAAPHPIL